MTTVRLPDDLVQAIDNLRGDIPRERWIRRILSDHVAQIDMSYAIARDAPTGVDARRS